MFRRLVLCAIVVAGLALVVGDAFADDPASFSSTCPATAKRNTSIPLTVTFKNSDTLDALTITRAALALHLGNVTLIGPVVFNIPTTIVPKATFVPPPPGCFGCPGSVISAKTPLPVNVPIPPQARPGTFITVGLQFFGTVGTSTIRESMGGDACQIEIVP